MKGLLNGKKVTIEVAQEGDLLTFTIIDEGVGIAENRKEAIFNAFVRADEKIGVTYGGTGLGLAISNNLTKLLGGSINLISKVGKGSEFKLSIPYKQSKLIVKESKFRIVEDFSNESTILVIDDNMISRTLIKAFLGKFGLSAHYANNGELGIKKAKELTAEGKRPDLILMDLQMPVLDGIEASRIIRNHSKLKQIPIVAISADVFTEQKSEASAAGITDYLIKPIEIEMLQSILKKYLATAN